ncbi:MAG: SMC-Scp complex subunit ScpB [Thermodesulfovibrionales bacterium]|nr:SMC-Scp complex subunit ScpB [Thermodesulfovibrionales bacterium]
MDRKEKKDIIELLLFTSGEPLTISSIKEITGLPEEEIKTHLDELIMEYDAKNGGIIIKEIANGYQMITNPAYSEWVKRIKRNVSQTKLSMAALETLAIIAYKQPIIKAEIEQIRGVNSDGAIKTLLERRLIKIVGKKEAPGRPFLYGTTKEFLEYFGLRDLTELPTLKDLSREEFA